MMIANCAIGILGGTFDPIHLGHLRLALQMQQKFRLNHVRIMPCYQNTDKPKPIASISQRIAMISQAIADEPSLKLDTIEIERRGISYTLDTLQILKLKFPDTPLAFILGMDTFLSLPNWRNWEDIFHYTHLLLANRPHYPLPAECLSSNILADRLEMNHEMIHCCPSGKIFLADIEPFAISSANIRYLIANGRDPRDSLPDPVYNFIQQCRIYQRSDHQSCA